jgi:signal transduction histidine kinase
MRASRKSLSIRTRLTLIVLSLSLAGLAVGFVVVGVRTVGRMRTQRAEAMTAIASMTGDNCSSTLGAAKTGAGGYEDEAKERLKGLEALPDIDGAALYAWDGALFATYQRDGASIIAWPRKVAVHEPAGQELTADATTVRLPVMEDPDRVGTIVVVGSNSALSAEISSFLYTLVAIGIALAALSGVFAWLLGRRITRPVLALADVARRITAGSDTSLRAPTGHGGEVAALASGFNAMLAKLEEREREVVSSRDTLRAVIDASPVAIIGIEKGGTVGLWSAAAAILFDTVGTEAIGKPLAAVVPDAAVMTLTRLWARAATEPVGTVELELGGERVLAMQAAPLPGGGVVVAVADVTERRRAAEALAERAQQLQRVQKMEVVGRLASGVAHDFNNLITVIMAAAQMLQWRTAGRTDVRGYVDNIVDAAQRGAALSRRLLAFSRQQAVDAKAVDTRQVLTELEKMVRSVVGEQIHVTLDTGTDPAVVKADQGQLEQVLLNMVLNARDAMPNGGTLTLRTRPTERGAGPGGELRPGSWVAVTIADTGIGMSAETRARVFEPFFTTKAHGTGLGLATAYQIAHDLGGEITVESEPEKGTTFTLILPRAAAGAHDTVPAAAAPVAGTDTVLVVEDQPDLRNLIQIMLAEAGYHVIAASSATEALALGTAAGVHIDLLLTDVVMPAMTGPQLAAELVRRAPHIEVLYMSGYFGDALTQYGLDEAAAALIHKPFKPEQLLKVVRDLLDARPAGRRSRRPSEHIFGKAPEPGSA